MRLKLLGVLFTRFPVGASNLTGRDARNSGPKIRTHSLRSATHHVNIATFTTRLFHEAVDQLRCKGMMVTEKSVSKTTTIQRK